MEYRRYGTLLFLFALLGSCLSFGQGLNTTASPDDWEEINFEFNSHILTDGYPSLLRLAELLKQHPDYRVRIEGHADVIGSNRYNERLGLRRAEQVRDFLVKYGANAGNLTAATFGETQPKIPSRNKEARFMNRRVMLTVTDASGKVITQGPIGQVVPDLEQILGRIQKCCDDILKRLDRLDEIANLLQKMVGDNDTLRKDLDGLRKAHDALDAYVKGLPKPLTAQETASIVDTRTAEQIERARMPRFSIINANAGADQSGNLTFTGRGRLFLPFKEQLAVQMQGEYMYFRDRQEGQADIGLVNRFATRMQAGLFASFKHVNFTGNDPGRNIFTDRPSTIVTNRQFGTGQIEGNGVLGQASLTLDYLFGRGKIGVFGSKGFMNDAVLGRAAISNNIFEEAYLRTIDQVGLSTTLGLVGNTYLEGNFGYLKSRGNADRPGGTLRFIFPLSDRFAFTLEGGMNETLVSRDNTGRVVAGFQFGNFMRPRDYMEGYNGVQHAVPVDVPRIRYEVLTRRTRTGNDAPVANAGPDQIGVAAGQVTLDASGSYDPDGDAITYQWSQVSGPSVSISGMNSAQATFTAVQGQSYGFRLVVRDSTGLQGVDTANVTTTSTQPVQIVRFQASPDRIRAGQSSTIDWQVLNAESIEITEVGRNLANSGSQTVNPTRTTQYRLTARNAGGEVSATTTVVVEEQPRPQFLTCTVTPMNITRGESATIAFATSNATDVTISGGIGSVGSSGSRVITPTETTTYTLTGRGEGGESTCTVTVQVTAQAERPRVVSFTANPTSITAGNASTLSWNIENAQTVEISGIGTVAASGTREVRPTQNTTYTLTARNASGETTATATVTVTAGPGLAPTLTACTASPATSAAPGNPVQLAFAAANATAVTISGVSGANLTSPVTVTPQATTTYTVTATGTENRTATCTITVTVTPTTPPVAIISGPSVIETVSRQLTLDASQSTNPAGGALTYEWTPLSTGAAVLDQGQQQTRVQLGGLFGDYVFQLRVRNAAGQEGTTTVTVRFQSTRVF